MFPLSNITAKKKIKLEISGFHIQITKEISDFIEKKVKKLNKYFKKIISVHVMLKVEKSRYKTEINISAKGSAIHGEQINRDLYISIDRAIDKVVRQSQKYKDKMKYGEALKLLYRRLERKLNTQLRGKKISTKNVIDLVIGKDPSTTKLKIKRLSKFMDRILSIKEGKYKIKTEQDFEELFFEMGWAVNNI